MKKIVFYLFMVIGLPGSALGQTQEKEFPAAQLREELKMMKTTLEEAHPGLDIFGQRAELNRIYGDLDEQLSGKASWTNIEFYRLVNPMIAALQDGHMKFLPQHVYYPFYFNHSNVFPFIVRFDDQKRLIITASEDAGHHGKIVESINGKPATSVVDTLCRNMFVDGKSSAAPAQVEQYFAAWYSDYIDNPTEFRVSLRSLTGTVEQLSLKGIDYNTWKRLDSASAFLKPEAGLKMLTGNIAYLRIPGFMTPKKPFRKFLDDSFRQIKDEDAENLIIDLRGNEGGNDREGMDLYRYLAQDKFEYYQDLTLAFRKVSELTYHQHLWFPFPKVLNIFVRKNKDGGYRWTLHKNFGTHRPARNAFSGRVWILQDGLSFSVTTEFLSRVKADRRATLVGSETGGGYKYDFSGAFLFLNLPYTKMTMANPVASYRMAVPDGGLVGHGISPDYPMSRSASAVATNKDEVLAKLLQLISTEKTTAEIRK